MSHCTEIVVPKLQDGKLSVVQNEGGGGISSPLALSPEWYGVHLSTTGIPTLVGHACTPGGEDNLAPLHKVIWNAIAHGDCTLAMAKSTCREKNFLSLRACFCW